jgi:Ca-activated chloride channel family protein
MKFVRICFIILIGLSAMNHLSWTQEAVGGTIVGAVVDKLGEPIKDAKVTATIIDSKREILCISDAHGAYKLAELPAGDYWVTAEKDGYQSHRYTDVVVKIGKTIKLDMKLQPPGEITYD